MLEFRFRSKPYLAFLRRQPCVRAHLHGRGGRPEWSPFYLVIDPDHTRSQKYKDGSDAEALPVCRWCHEEKHHPSPRELDRRAGVEFYRHAGIVVAVEIVRLHKQFLLEEQLAMLPEETFEQCLERNGLGSNAKGKESRTTSITPATHKNAKKGKKKKASMWWKFTKKFKPPDWK